nr:putative integron gene cassette protein [uncultured bacterium]
MQNRQYLERPTKEAMRGLPEFDGLPLGKILLVRTAADARFAHSEICKSIHVGFDIESKPSFVAGQPRTGPHVLQLSTQQQAFLFRPGNTICDEILAEIIQSKTIIKVGFGLSSDRAPIQRKLGVKLRSAIELSVLVHRLGYRPRVGLQSAVSIVLNQYLQKSKKLTLSNWNAKLLSARQILYAANDAYASLQVYSKLTR